MNEDFMDKLAEECDANSWPIKNGLTSSGKSKKLVLTTTEGIFWVIDFFNIGVGIFGYNKDHNWRQFDPADFLEYTNAPKSIRKLFLFNIGVFTTRQVQPRSDE